MARLFGATDLLNPADGDVLEQMSELVGEGVDYAFEVVGSKATAEQAFRVLRRGGLAVVVGVVFDTPIEISGDKLISECAIMGSAGGSSMLPSGRTSLRGVLPPRPTATGRVDHREDSTRGRESGP